MLPTVSAAGLAIFTEGQQPSFLLLRHKDRWDLPKGHAEPGESLLETALRETEEETGISRELLRIDPDFQFNLEYEVDSKRYGKRQKTVRYFLGFVHRQLEIELTEHVGFQWFAWPTPPIQSQTIDPLLEAIGQHFASSGASELT